MTLQSLAAVTLKMSTTFHAYTKEQIERCLLDPRIVARVVTCYVKTFQAPSKASLYMSSLLKPLKEFLEKHNSIITEEDKKSIILRSLHIVTEQ